MIPEIEEQEKLKENNKKKKDKTEKAKIVPMIKTDLFDKAANEAEQKLKTHFSEFLSSYFDTDV